MYKKKKSMYNPVLGTNNSTKFSRRNSFDKVDFPDDFNSLSQGPKRQKLDEENKVPLEKKQATKTKDIIIVDDDLQVDLMDDDFDFSQAVDEIDQIEIAASQIPAAPKGVLKQCPQAAKTVPKQQNKVAGCLQHSTKLTENEEPDILDILLSGDTKSLSQNPLLQNGPFQLKLPKKTAKSDPPVCEEDKLSHSGKLPFNSVANPMTKQQSSSTIKQHNSFTTKQHSITTKQHNEMFLEKRQNDIKLKKENDSIELLNTYKRKMQEAEQKYFSKDGEIGILRETLRKQSEEERKSKEKIHELEHNLKTQQSEKEARLLAEVEKLKTQLTFKEKEVQDVIEKQKKISTTKASPSRMRSPKIGFYSDAFERSGKGNSAQQCSSKKTSVKPTAFQCKPFKNLFQRNIVDFSGSKDIITDANNKVICCKNITFNCRHTLTEQISDDRMLNFSTNLLSSLELIDYNDFYIPEFVNKVTYYVSSLYDLLSLPNSQGSEISEGRSNFSSENSDTTSKKECLLCTGTYKNGLKCLAIATNVSPVVKGYLINGLVKFMGKELEVPSDVDTNVEIGGKKYFLKYPTLSKFILVKEIANIDVSHKVNNSVIPFDAAVQFWTTLGQLSLIDNHKEVENSLFLIHLSLLSYPLKSSSEIHCSYLVDNELVSRHLNVITVNRILSVLDLLQKLLGLKTVTNLMCNKSDRCPLLLIYNWLINEDLQKHGDVLKVFQELVSLLSSVIGHHQTHAYAVLLESTCRCSNEIIEFLIMFLFDEFKYFQQKVFLSAEGGMKSNDLLRFSCFRQGMALLCLLCCYEKNLGDKRSAVECNYIYLFAGTVKMYRKIPWINDKEVLDLEDVLDMDQYMDFDATPDKMEADPPLSMK